MKGIFNVRWWIITDGRWHIQFKINSFHYYHLRHRSGSRLHCIEDFTIKEVSLFYIIAAKFITYLIDKVALFVNRYPKVEFCSGKRSVLHFNALLYEQCAYKRLIFVIKISDVLERQFYLTGSFSATQIPWNVIHDFILYNILNNIALKNSSA